MQIPIRTAPTHRSTSTEAHTFPGWDQFVTWFTDVQPTTLPKGDLPIWSPHVRRDGDNGRRADGITHMAPLAVLDLDSADMQQCQALLGSLAGAGLAHAWHSSYSHSPAQPKLRIAILLDRQPTAEEWPDVWLSIFTETGCLSDTRCKDTARIYYVPARPEDGPEPWAGHRPGQPLPVDQLPAPPQRMRQAVERPVVVATETQLKALHQSWSRRTQPPPSVDVLGAMLAGQELAPKGARNSTLWQLAKDLVAGLGNPDPASLAEQAGPSIRRMEDRHRDGETTVEQFESMIERTLQYQLAQIATDHHKTLAQESTQLEQDLAAVGLDRPYTDEQIETWAQNQGVDVDTFLRSRLIIRNGRHVSVFFNGEYEEEQAADQGVEGYLHQMLAPLRGRIVLTEETNEGPRPMGTKALVDHYGHHVTKLVMSAEERHSRLQDHATFVRAVMHRRPLTPRQHPEVEALLSQPKDPAQRAKLLDWVASAYDLGNPVAALYLRGSANTGKTLLANGLARLFGTGDHSATDMEEVLGKFNEQILYSGAITFADEALPESLLKTGGTREFRKIITRNYVKLEGKGKAITRIYGHLRYIIAANGIRLFDQIDDHLTAADSEALMERLLYVDMGDVPLPPDTGEALYDTDKIAEHALWLAETRHVVPGQRLLVEGVDSELHRHMRIASGVTGRIMHVLCSKLLGGEALSKAQGLWVAGGHVYTTADYIYRALETVSRREWQPSAAMVGSALKEVSEPVKGGRRVDTKYLTQWAESTTFSDAETLEHRIQAHQAQKMVDTAN